MSDPAQHCLLLLFWYVHVDALVYTYGGDGGQLNWNEFNSVTEAQSSPLKLTSNKDDTPVLWKAEEPMATVVFEMLSATSFALN
tara:strand:- start:1047 stop:1298 length:252 start_codon:yes stop_codon:yes gene_type:complete